MRHIQPEELQQMLESGSPLYLVDTLPADHFNKIHLSGARNACVFEVNFPEQLSDITTDLHSEVVFYGSSVNSRDADTAAEKSQRLGYTNLAVLVGGIAAWKSAGYAIEGQSPADAGDTQTMLTLADGRYTAVSDACTINWFGRNRSSTHHGTVQLLEGELVVERNEITGRLEVDMDSIKNLNLAGDELQPVLEAHLKSDDFFFVELFPRATFTLKQGSMVPYPYLTSANYAMAGELTLRGVKADLNFAATVIQEEQDMLHLEAHFDLDRTRWNIIYGSTRFFEHLGMHQVFDDISLQLRLLMEPATGRG